jgi:hypothetical protein
LVPVRARLPGYEAVRCRSSSVGSALDRTKNNMPNDFTALRFRMMKSA